MAKRDNSGDILFWIIAIPIVLIYTLIKAIYQFVLWRIKKSKKKALTLHSATPKFITQQYFDTTTIKEKIRERLSQTIGQTKPVCPTCNAVLPKMPIRSGVCKSCGNKYFLHERPYDTLNKNVFDDTPKKVIVNESQLKQIKTEQFNIKIMKTSKFFEYEQDYIETYNKKHPKPIDVFNYKLSVEKEYDIAHNNYESLYQLLINHAVILYDQNKYKEALINLLQAMYMEAHGMPVYAKTRQLLNEHIYKTVRDQNPEANPFGFTAHPYTLALGCIRKLKLTYPELEELFLNAEFDDLPYKISRETLLPDLEEAYDDLIDTLEQKQMHNASNTSFSVYI